MNRIACAKVLVIGAMATALLICAPGASRAGEAAEPRPAPDRWGHVVEGFQLSARLEKESYAAGSPIWVTVAVRNAAKEPLRLLESLAPDHDYTAEVKDEYGKPVPGTRYAGVLAWSSRIRTRIEPGMEVQRAILLSRLIDMTLSGTYTVTVKRRVSKAQGRDKVEVASNTILVKVEDPANQPLTPPQMPKN